MSDSQKLAQDAVSRSDSSCTYPTGFWQHGSTPIATFISWLGICIQVHMSRSDQDPVDIGDSRWGLYPVPSREDPNNPFKTLSRYPLQDLKYGTSVPVGDYLILRKDGENGVVMTMILHRWC